MLELHNACLCYLTASVQSREKMWTCSAGKGSNGDASGSNGSNGQENSALSTADVDYANCLSVPSGRFIPEATVVSPNKIEVMRCGRASLTTHCKCPSTTAKTRLCRFNSHQQSDQTPQTPRQGQLLGLILQTTVSCTMWWASCTPTSRAPTSTTCYSN